MLTERNGLTNGYIIKLVFGEGTQVMPESCVLFRHYRNQANKVLPVNVRGQDCDAAKIDLLSGHAPERERQNQPLDALAHDPYRSGLDVAAYVYAVRLRLSLVLEDSKRRSPPIADG